MTLIDVSVPIREGMPIYDRNPGVSLTKHMSISDGEVANVTRIELGAHTGTHVDAPHHFYDDGPRSEAIDQDVLNGPCYVVDATMLDRHIDAAALATLELPRGERLLFRTPNSRLWELDHFTPDFIRFTGSGARELIGRGVRLLGIDYLSIGDQEAHRALLGADVLPLEGLDLRNVPPGAYWLTCTTVRVVGSDGAPARALLSPLRGGT